MPRDFKLIKAAVSGKSIQDASHHNDHYLITAYFDFNGKIVPVMVDTGATISCLPENGMVLQHIKPKILTANLNVNLADGSMSHVNKKVDVLVKPTNSTNREPYEVAPFYITNNCSNILGYQALIGSMCSSYSISTCQP